MKRLRHDVGDLLLAVVAGPQPARSGWALEDAQAQERWVRRAHRRRACVLVGMATALLWLAWQVIA